MKIIQHVKEWTKYKWPTIAAQEPRFFPLATAYACFICRTVQDGAPRGVCVRCGSDSVRPVDALVDLALSEIERMQQKIHAQRDAQNREKVARGVALHAAIEAAKAKKYEAAEEALKKNQAQVARSLAHRPDQEPQSLTEFRVKD